MRITVPYSWKIRIAPYTYYLIGAVYRDQDLKNLAEEMKYQAQRDNPEMIAEAQAQFKTILVERHLAPDTEPVADDKIR